MFRKHSLLFAVLFTCFLSQSYGQSKGYKNFKVAVYARSYEVVKMGDLQWIDSIWTIISAQVHIDKIYLETHRDLVIVPEATLIAVKKYFRDKGIETAGGITYTVNEPNRFETFCYNNKEHRQKVKEIMEYSAKHFDEVILDDFFFTNCKCEKCIAAKGDNSWTKHRLDLMTEAASSLILKPAKAVNPKVKVVIKYPNWYHHFQGLGFNLEKEPAMFDGLYTGTETRDAYTSAQHLQPYLGYAVFRYFENLKPGKNGGGWVDTGGLTYLDRYGEQLWLTLFAGAPEVTLFDFRQLQYPLSKYITAPWQGQGCSYDLKEMMKQTKEGSVSTIARAAGYAFEKVDPFLGELGKPVGIPCYQPYHATGEDFLPNFLGMAGLPIDIVPVFPASAPLVILTESAAADAQIIGKIKKQLIDGKTVVITSGLLRALEKRGIQDIAELRFTGNVALCDEFVTERKRYAGTKKILIPQIKYLTNDSWEVASAIDGPNGWPLLHEADYGKGRLLVLTIPENYADLYQLPEPVLTKIRALVAANQFAQLQGPGNVSLFLYDNKTLIVESFRDETVVVKIAASAQAKGMKDLLSGENMKWEIQPAKGGWDQSNIQEKKTFEFSVPPHSFRVFRLEE